MEPSQTQGGSSLRKPTIEKLKRSRGTPRSLVLSCLECRRLKLKCDREFPCSSCVKRGLQSICPNGTLQSGKSSKYILTENEELRRNASQLMDRIHFLERALLDATKGYDWELTQPHPHLNEMISAHFTGQAMEGTDKRRRAEGEHGEPATNGEAGEVDELQHSLGTLIVDEGGHERWLGATAASESYILSDAEGEVDLHSSYEDGRTFPFFLGSHISGVTKEMLLEKLPTYEETSGLVEVYLGHIAWMCQPFDRPTLFRETIRPAYTPDKLLLPNGNLALLFIILAVGSIMDLTGPPDYPSAKKYQHLAETALVLNGDMLCHPTIAILQTLQVMGIFLQMMPGTDGPASALIMHGIAVRLGQSIGLHRDPARFGTMSDDEVRTRRRLWWELVNADAWQSLSLGRPMSVFQQNFDTQPPNDTAETLGSTPYFQHRKLDFTKQCLLPLMEHALSITPPTYTQVLQLDSRLRSWEAPGHDDPVALGTDSPRSALTLPVALLCSAKEICILYLHRAYYTRALREHPEDPLKSRYAPSFVAAYRSSVDMLQRVHKLYNEQPALTLRFWVFSVHAISAAITLGALVSQSPGSKFAESALLELEAACHFFENAKGNTRIARSLPTIHILKQKSYFALSQYRAGLWVAPDRNGLPLIDDNDAPGIITDMKRVSAKHSGSSSSTPPAAVPASGDTNPPEFADIPLHPHLAEYLQSLRHNYTEQATTAPFPQSYLHQSPPQAQLQAIIPLIPPPHAHAILPSLNARHPQMENRTFTDRDQPMSFSFPDQLPEIDLTAMSSYIPLANFASADEFAPMEDIMVTQSMNEEWNRFMRQL